MSPSVECPLCARQFPEDQVATHAAGCGLATSPRPKRKHSQDANKKVAPLFVPKKAKLDSQESPSPKVVQTHSGLSSLIEESPGSRTCADEQSTELNENALEEKRPKENGASLQKRENGAYRCHHEPQDKVGWFRQRNSRGSPQAIHFNWSSR